MLGVTEGAQQIQYAKFLSFELRRSNLITTTSTIV